MSRLLLPGVLSQSFGNPNQFYENFSGATIGVAPGDFDAPWGGLSLDIASGSPLAGSDRHLSSAYSEGDSYERRCIRWLAPGDSAGKTTVRARVSGYILGTGTSRHIPGALVSGAGASRVSRTGYIQWTQTDRSRITRYDSAAETILANTTSVDVLPTTEIDLYVEIIRNGGSIDVRRWLAGDPRPASATNTATDATELGQGFVGVSHLPGINSAALKIYEIAVGINGADAPTGLV